MPLISVLVPVRDAAPWLPASLASLWRQSFRDFEVVAVDDGSRDGSGGILERAAARESRLRVAHTAARGLPRALNTALDLARGELIARHDGDDLSHRMRLALQHEHLARDPAAAVVGCRVRLFPAAGAGMRRWVAWHNGLLTHEAMAEDALIDSPLAHGTALIRRRALERVGGWRERDWPEDMDLWLRMLESGARLAKLPRTLYAWRQHAGSATRRDPRYRRERFLALRLAALERGLLRGARRLTLVGVGESLQVWSTVLEGNGRVVRRLATGRPAAVQREVLVPPIVLVFGSVPARLRWRAALRKAGLIESADFAFVA